MKRQIINFIKAGIFSLLFVVIISPKNIDSFLIGWFGCGIYWVVSDYLNFLQKHKN